MGRRLRALTTSAFVDFCADLWAERGYAVDTVDRRIRARRGETRLDILPVRRRTLLGMRGDAAVDVVVTPVDAGWSRRLADRLDARLVGPDELESMLRYGVDRARADALFRRHVGEPLSGVDVTPRGSNAPPEPAGTSDSDTLAGTVTTAVAVAGVACLVLAGVFAGVYSPGIVDEPGAPPSEAAEGAGVSTATQSPTAEPQGPVGVDGDRLDAEQFAAAHAAAVDNRSYRLIIQHSGSSQPWTDQRWRGAWQQATVADDRFLYSVVGYVEDASGKSEFAQFTVYGDGNETYRRSDIRTSAAMAAPTDTLDPDSDQGVFTDLITRYLVYYLSTSEVRVEQPTWNDSLYRVVATGQPRYVEEQMTDYEATAMVDEEGFVSSMSVSYLHHRNETAYEVQFDFEYANVGEVSVSPPVWYPNARGEANDTFEPNENATATSTTSEPANRTATTTAQTTPEQTATRAAERTATTTA